MARDVDLGLTPLRDLLRDWERYELDDTIYVAVGTEPSLDTLVNVLSFDPKQKAMFEGQRYLLGIEQVRDVVEALEDELGRAATPIERLRAFLHYAENDAFIDPRDAVGG